MRIVIAVTGTRGDVQPAVVLAHALAERGHIVRIGLPPNMIGDFRATSAHGTPRPDMRPLGLDTRAHLAFVAAARAGAGRNPLRRLRALTAMRSTGWDQLVDDLAKLVPDADLLVTGVISEQAALAYAEAARIPLVSLHHAPIRRNGRIGPVPRRLPGRSAPAVLAQWSVVDTAFWLLTRGRENRLRRRLGISPVHRTLATRLRTTPGAEIQAYDPMLGGGGAGQIGSDPTWAADSRDRSRPLTGFIGLPTRVRARIGLAPTEHSSALDGWLEAGEPPIYVGFGSMPLRTQRAVVDSVLEVAESLGHRVLLCAGWTDLDEDAGSETLRAAIRSGAVRVENGVDHDAVFARCAAIVHHGGAGTTAAAVRAGRPSVICSYGADQPFWGAELERLGVGVAMSMPRAGKGLDPGLLRGALVAALDPAVGMCARDLAARLIDHDTAVRAAVEVIDQHDHAAGDGSGTTGGAAHRYVEVDR